MINSTKNISKADFLEGTLLLIDKPLEWTSFDVVNKLRYTIKHRLNVKKIKVGHAGTLDPLATGLLLICTGRFTKKINLLTDLDKTYEGTFKLGATTKSYDAEMEEEEHFDTANLNLNEIKEATSNFSGYIDQFPPAYSAIKIDGVASYKRVRKGEDVKMKSRKVAIHEFDITDINMPFVDFRVRCSKGTYIRSLANDFGKALNNGAYLKRLRRTETGGYNVEDAWDLNELVEAIKTDKN